MVVKRKKNLGFKYLYWGAPKPAGGNLGSEGTKEQDGRYAHVVPVGRSRVPGWGLGTQRG